MKRGNDMGKTRRGVYYNLKMSEYTVTNGEIVLFFSSKVRMNKFISEYEDRRITTNQRIQRAIKSETFNTDWISDVQSYRDIETQGFFVVHNGLVIDESMFETYGGSKIMDKESPVWEKCSRPKVKERLNKISNR